MTCRNMNIHMMQCEYFGPFQNGFWGIKYLLIIGGMIGAFFIPGGTFGMHNDYEATRPL